MGHSTIDKQIVDGELELPPLRSLNDFILDSARFQLPNLKDLDKWGNRVVNNLLYYQTNYFFTAVVIFILVGWVTLLRVYFSTFSFNFFRVKRFL